MASGHRLYAPVVVDPPRSGARAAVCIARVVARPERPRTAYRLEVRRPEAGLCASVSRSVLREHGELEPPPCWVLGRNAGWGGTLLTGRSTDLARALAALAALEQAPPRGPTIATGWLHDSLTDPEDYAPAIEELRRQSPGALLPVEHINDKVLAAASWIRDEKLAFAKVVVPVAQASDGPDGGWERLRHDTVRTLECAAGADALVLARDLAHAANEVLSVDESTHFGASEIVRLRSLLWSLLYDAKRKTELLECADRLLTLVGLDLDETTSAGILGLAARLHAVVAGRFAALKLAREGERPVGWQQRTWQPADLAEHLKAEAERIESCCDALPPALRELQAHRLNLEATAGFVTLDFSGAVGLADQGLAIQRLLDTPRGERRKLLGTRAQFLWRQALRMAAYGAEGEARILIERGLQDVRQALDAANAREVEDLNDRARVRCSWVNAELSARALTREGWPDEQVDPVMQELQRLLGPFGPALDSAAQPSQDPAWALHLLYVAWALQEAWPRIVTHWEALAARRNPFSKAGKRMERCVLGPFEAGEQVLPAVHHIAPLLAEAALRAARPSLLARTLQAAPREPGCLAVVELARWLPVRGGWTRGWVEGARPSLQLPAAGQGSRWPLRVVEQLHRQAALSLSAPSENDASEQPLPSSEEETLRKELLWWVGQPR